MTCYNPYYRLGHCMLRFILIFTILLAGGCYDQGEITLHQPQVYKGKPDPHLETNQALDDRFMQIQSDR